MKLQLSFKEGASILTGKTISHYKILDKLGEGGMSQNGPRTLFVSGRRFADPAEAPADGGAEERKREVLL